MPTAVAVVVGIVSVVGAVAGAVGQAAAGAAAKEAGDINAAQAESDAAFVRDITKEEVRKFRKQGEKFQATQEAAIGASGLRLSGSALDLLQDTEAEIERDIKSIQEAGEQRAQGIETQGETYKLQGEAALTAGILGAGATLLTGIAGFASNVPRRNTTSSLSDPFASGRGFLGV